MTDHTRLRIVLIVATLSGLGLDLFAGKAHAQAPTLPADTAKSPGGFSSTLGPIPGAGGNPFRLTPGTDPAFLGGRPGPSFTRAPSLITTPGGTGVPAAPGLVAPARIMVRNVPLYGSLDIPDAAEEEGPPDGLTLDAAIDRLLRENLALQALRWQIPAARADVLTASLRANPVLYADSQLVPYGQYTRSRPGGPTQYDINVTHPVDYSFKRQARTAAALSVVSVLEAQFQNAARIQIDNLYTIYVDVLAARETVRYAKASEIGLNRLLEITQTLLEKADVTRADVGRTEAMRDAARVSLVDAEETLRKTKRALALLLNMPPDQAASLEVRGTIADLAPPPPTDQELTGLALNSRPDLAAQRLGVDRAKAVVKLERASRFGDAYVLYQPYTFQNNYPTGLKSATSYALGITVPLPVSNRNQGGVLRARLNVEQTRSEVAALERRIVNEVRDAEGAYAVTRAALQKIESDLLPAARRLRDDTFRLFTNGELTAVEANAAQKDYNQVVRQYRDTLIRHRRSMLLLNTAVGRRILP